jgi:hypothetical protein
MANTAIIRDAYGIPAMFVGSKTGKDDAPLSLSGSAMRTPDAVGRMGCASRLGWRSPFLGGQALMDLARLLAGVAI